MLINFQQIFDTLEEGVVNLAKTSSKEIITQATSDGQSILDSLKSELQTWTVQLANGDIMEDDFKDLVLGQKDSLKMVALKDAGILQIQADAFKNSVLNLIITTVTTAI
jgi:hypothetical protein